MSSDRRDRHLQKNRPSELDAEIGHQGLHVLPHVPFRRGIPQQIRRVVGADHLGGAVAEPPLPEPADGLGGLEQGLGGGGAEAADVLRGDDLELPQARYDAIFSVLDLQTVNDVPGALIQMRRALKPDGFLLACLFAGDTLMELQKGIVIKIRHDLHHGKSDGKSLSVLAALCSLSFLLRKLSTTHAFPLVIVAAADACDDDAMQLLVRMQLCDEGELLQAVSLGHQAA
jgi:SAM-dependent methyltransferase